ncbi:MAG TPA: BadF/BadG/BcrA/BcrD ATPase family protein [Abditibacteriaceae bacterium]|nr:BadF/BadG/BcrA/BcrD ATPase family protein [Abditibacteriaceae bacterium]
MKYFLGMDGGGSETRAVVMTDAFEVIGRGVAGASNHYVAGVEQAATNCALAAEDALADARRLAPDITRDAIAAWGFGLAGVRRESDAAAMRPYLNQIVSNRPWSLDTDAAAAHSGAFTGGPGIILSAGTGAICLGIDDHGERFYADGWGPLLGDEGSAYWMGMEALRAVCRAADGRGQRTRLTAPILGALNVANCDALVQFMYSDRCTRDQIARLSRVVISMAEAGAQVAISIRDRAVAHLGNTAAATARAMLTRVQERAGFAQPVPQEIVIALRGGLFDDDFLRASVGYTVGERMVELKRDFLPLASWRVVKPQLDAAAGAALLAQKLVS